MNLLYKADRKFGRYAIKNLMKYIVVLYIAGFAMNLIMPSFYYEWLMLDIDKLLQGQVWRLLTFLIQPPDSNILFLLISVYLYYMIGNSLENAWGSFVFNLYFLSGILFNILAVVIIYITTKAATGVGYSYPISIGYINQSLFFAFAALFPNIQFMLFFVIPVKVKYLAWIYAAIMGYQIFSSIRFGIIAEDISYIGIGIGILVAMANFLIFFLMTRNYKKIAPSQMRRKVQFKRSMQTAERESTHTVTRDGRNVITRHKCAICGRTEMDDENLEFRFCSKCNGNYEYCSDHLFSHEHVK